MSRTVPFGTDDQAPFRAKIVGGRTILTPIDTGTAAPDDKGELEDGGGAVAVNGSAGVGSGTLSSALPTGNCRLGKENWKEDGTKPAASVASAGSGFLPSVSGRAVLGTVAAPPGRDPSTLSSSPTTALPPIGQKASLSSKSEATGPGTRGASRSNIAGSGSVSVRNDGRAGMAVSQLAARCSQSLDYDQLEDLSREMQLSCLEKSGLLTEERFRQIVQDHCPLLDECGVEWLIGDCRHGKDSNSSSSSSSDGDSVVSGPALICCKEVLQHLKDTMSHLSPLAHSSVPINTTVTTTLPGMQKSPLASRSKPLRHPHLSTLGHQLSSSEPSLLFIGKRPEAHTEAAVLPVPQIRRELRHNDPLNISTVLSDTSSKEIGWRPNSSAALLHQRHDAKLLVSIERDWTASGSRVVDLSALQLAMADLDPDRTGKITTSQVLQVCRQHQLPILTQALHHLCRRCDHSSDGYVRWVEFIDFLERARPISLADDVMRNFPQQPSCGLPHMKEPLSKLSSKLKLPTDSGASTTDNLPTTAGQFGHLQLPRIDGLKSESTGDLRSGSSSSLCDRESAIQGMNRLKAALLLTTTSVSGHAEMSVARRLVKMHNVVYHLSLSSEILEAMLNECAVSSRELNNTQHRSISAGSPKKQAAGNSQGKALNVKSSLSSSSVTSIGKAKQDKQLLDIDQLITSMCVALNVDGAEAVGGTCSGLADVFDDSQVASDDSA